MLDSSVVLMAPILAGALFSGRNPTRTGNHGFRLIATLDTYRTKDGYLSIGANHQAQFGHLCKVLGTPELVADPRFADHRSHMAHGAELRQALEAASSEVSAEEVEPKLAAAGVPAGRVREVLDALTHPHLAERGVVLTT